MDRRKSADAAETTARNPAGRAIGAQIDKSTCRNHLLASVTDDDFASLAAQMIQVDLALDEVLIEGDTLVEHVWFIETGICSMIAMSADGRQAEVGVIGRDGIVDTTVVHGIDRTPLNAVMQIAGTAWRLPAEVLLRVQADRPALRALLLAYAQSFSIQTAQAALAYAAYSIPQRLARWLLMTHDRLDGDDIHLTHERFSLMLGVRRAGVTVAIQALERKHLIEARRGVVRVIDRDALREYAGEGYGVPEAEYERLFKIALS